MNNGVEHTHNQESQQLARQYIAESSLVREHSQNDGCVFFLVACLIIAERQMDKDASRRATSPTRESSF